MKAQQGVGSGPSPLELDHLAVMDEHCNQDPLGLETRRRKQKLVKEGKNSELLISMSKDPLRGRKYRVWSRDGKGTSVVEIDQS